VGNSAEQLWGLSASVIIANGDFDQYWLYHLRRGHECQASFRVSV
jgi:hypothetical protein